MRPLTALVILAACQCLHAHQHSRTPYHLIKDTLQGLIGKQNKPVRRIITCTETLGFSKCLSSLGAWRAERAIEAFTKDPKIQMNLTEDVEKFPWKKYTNITDEELNSELLDGTQKLLKYRPLTFDMISGYSANLKSNGNGTFNVDIHKNDEAEGRSSMKKIQKELYRLAPFLLAPGILVSSIVPFVLPSLKMFVGMVVFLNQMALAGAVFTLLRNNAFNDKYEHKIVYVNNGYDNERLKFAASNNEEHFHTNHMGLWYDDAKTRFQDGHHFEDENFENIKDVEELPPIAVSPEWIKEYTDNKMMALLNKPHPLNNNLFFNGQNIRRSKPEKKVE